MSSITRWAVCLLPFLLTTICRGANSPQMDHAYGALPVTFEQNTGQTAPAVDFLARGPGYGIFLTSAGALLRLPDNDIRIKLVAANPQPAVHGRKPLGTLSHYFRGRQAFAAPSFGRVEYRRVYRGTDLVYRGGQRELEFDFVLLPGADPRQIRLAFEGAQAVSLEPDGRLRLHIPTGDLWIERPRVYQKGRRKEIGGSLVLLSDNQVGFRLGAYDPALPLVIDPVLSYSTYLAGSSFETVRAIAVDGSGCAYVAGWTGSTDYPTAQPVQGSRKGSSDAFVAKLNPAGTSLVYSTYLGGSADDQALGIAVDKDGSAIVTGWTDSADFPVVAAAQAVSGGGRDAFLARLNPAGDALVFSTFLGGSGSESANGVAVDTQGGIYVGGETDSLNFPVRSALAASNQGLSDGFVAKYSNTGVPVYATYLGGAGQDRVTAIAVDNSGQAYITGATYSSNFPTMNALQPHSGGLQDAFVAKLDATGGALVYSTYLGGSGGSAFLPESGLGIAVDQAGDAYVTGITSSTDFPTRNPLHSCAKAGATDAFVAKLNEWGNNLVYGTCLGGGGYNYAAAIAVDSAGSATVAGYTTSVDFPVVNSVQSRNAGLSDAFVATLTPAGDALTFGTYLGGQREDNAQAVALDAAGNIYVAGQTLSADFPTAHALQTRMSGSPGGFVARLGMKPEGSDDGNSSSSPEASACAGGSRAAGLACAAFILATASQPASVANLTGQFAYINSSFGLVNDQVSSMVEDSTGALYLTTGYSYLAGSTTAGGGVSRWDHRQFVNLTTAQGLASNTVQASLYDPSTNLVWFGTDSGISRYSPASGTFQATLLSGVKITSLKRDGAGTIWAGSYGSGVYRFSAAGALIAQYTHSSTSGGLVDDHIAGLALDGLNNLWVGTDRGAPNGSNFNSGGISRVAIGSLSWTPIDMNGGTQPPPAPLSADADRINSIEVDASNNVWMTIRDNGAVRRTQAGVISSFRYNSSPPFGDNGSTDNFAFTVYRDSSNNLWFGWGGYGTPMNLAVTFLPASQVNSAAPTFVNYNQANDQFPSNLVISFYSENASTMYFGFQGGGFARLGGPAVLPGWPQALKAFPFHSSPVLADLEGKGKLDIIVGDTAGYVSAFRPDGSLLWQYDAHNAFPVGTAGAVSIQSSPAVGDVDGDGDPEVVVGVGGDSIPGLIGVGQGGVIILSRTGTLKQVVNTYDITGPGGPRDGYQEGVFATPVLANVDNDPEPEILVGAFDNLFHAFNWDGTPIYARDKDGDGRFGEDPPGDYTPNAPFEPNVWAPGWKGVDDDGNGEIDEGNSSDDDEDGWIDEDIPEFPSVTGDSTVDSAVVGDLLGTGQPAIVFGHDFAGGVGQPFGRGGVLRGLDNKGNPLPGFPKGNLEQVIWSSPVLVDLDGDGALEIVHGSGLDEGTVGSSPSAALVGQLVYAWRRDGSSFLAGGNGRFATTQGQSSASFAVGDIDNDGQPELVIVTSSLRNKAGQLIDASGNPTADANAVGQLVYAFRHDGTLVPGFPVRPYPEIPGVDVVGSPILADVNGDGYLDIIVPVRQGLIVIDHTGRVISGMGVFENLQDGSYLGEITSTAAVGDLNGDGNLELVWVVGTGNNAGGIVRVVSLGPVNSTVQRSWPMFLRGPNRNGVFDVTIGRAQAYENSNQLQLSVQAFAGRNPIASVTIDLSAIGGSSAFALVDNGTNGDAVANDGIFGGSFAVGGVTPGRYQLPVTVTDSVGRTSQQTIYYARRGAGKQISPSVSSLDFGSVNQGLSDEGYFSIMNVSNAASVTISSVTSSSSQFAVRIPSSFPQTLAPGQVLALRLVFKPDFSASGLRNGTLTVSSDDAVSPTRTIPLSGTATVGSGGISPAVASLGFNTAVGSYQDLYLNVTSTGSTPLVIKGVTFGNSSYVLWKPHPGFPRAIDPGITQPLIIRFRPTSAGSFNTTMQLTTNDPANPTLTTSLVGSASISGTCSYSLGSTTTNVGSSGGSASVTVTAPGGCTWPAASNASWLTVTNGSSGSGNGAVSYSVAANASTSSRTGTLTIAARTFTVIQAGAAGCIYYLDGTSAGFGDAGGLGRVRVTLNQQGCAWTVFSDSVWITLTSATSFNGSGAALYTVAANNSGVTRTGHLTIAGQTYTINQIAGCTFTISISSVSVPWQGQQGTIQLTASNSSCPWVSYSDQNWAQQYPQSGTGSAAVSYTIYPTANTGGKTANIYLADKDFQVYEDLNPAVEDNRFVGLMYFGFLGRAPSPTELSTKLNALQQGTITRTDLAVSLFNSSEFNNNGRFIAGAYVGILGRDAEYAGWLFQRSAMNSGAINQMQLLANMLNSLEYQLKYGTPANDVFVNTLYNNLLRRDPTSTELANQLALLQSGTSRAQVVYNLLTGAEFQQDSGPRLTAFLQYACLLLRDAEQWERDYWANLMATNTMTVNQVFYDFVNSAEMGIELH